MSKKRIGIRIIKIFSYFIGGLLLLALLINLWFRFYAERTLEKIVSIQSNGLLELKLKKLNFTYRENQLNFEGIEIRSVADSNSVTAYQFKVRKLSIKTRSLWDFARKKELDIEAFEIYEPETFISILKEKASRHTDISIPAELARVYDGIQKALTALHVRRFEVKEGIFHLTNSTSATQLPLDVYHIQMIVDNLNIDSTTKIEKDKFLSADSVIVRIYNQQLQLPDGKHQLAFSRFRFNSGLKLIEMDSCSIIQKQTDSSNSSFHLFFDTLKLANLSMNKLYLENKLEADSAYCINPHFSGLIDNPAGNRKNNSNTKNTDTHSTLFKNLFFDIKYVGIINAQLSVSKQDKDKQTHFSSAQNNFVVYGFRSNDSTLGKIKVDSIQLKLLQNELYTADSVYAIRFKDIIIKDDQLILDKLTITTDPKSNTTIRRKHSMDRFVLSGMDWTELIFNKNIKAEKATLYHPVVDRKNTIQLAGGSPKNLFELLKSYEKKFSLNELEIVDGNLHMQFAPGKTIDIRQGSALLSVNEALTAKNYNQLGTALKKMNLKKVSLSINQFQADLANVGYNETRKEFSFKELKIHDNAANSTASASQVIITHPTFNDSGQHITIDGLRWKSAKADWIVPAKGKKATTPSQFSISINAINGSNSELKLSREKQVIKTFLRSLQLSRLQSSSGGTPRMEGLQVDGSDFSVSNLPLSIKIENYSITDTRNLSLKGISVAKSATGDSLELTSNQISIEASINDFINGHINGESLIVNNPVIKIRKTASNKKQPDSASKEIPVISWKNVSILNATADIQQQQPLSRDSLLTVFNLKASTVNTSKGNKAFIKDLSLRVDTVYFNQKGAISLTAMSPIEAVTENIHLEKTAGGWDWEGNMRRLSVQQLVAIKNQQTDSAMEIHAERLSAGNLTTNNRLLKEPSAFISANKEADLMIANITASNKEMTGKLIGIHYKAQQQQLRIDSVAVIPHQTREAYASARPFQSTFIEARTGAIIIDHPDLQKLVTDSALLIRSITITRPQVAAYRDKNLPFQYGIIKPLPTTLLQSIPFRFRVDTIYLKEATVRYTEKSDKTKDTGTIYLTHTNAILFPVTSMKVTDQDSLRLRVTSLIMGTAPVSVHFKESYTDSLAGFWVTARMPGTDLTFLNQALAPLLSVKLTSGTLDTLSFRAIGRDYLSFGEMKMLYHNLHVQFLKNGVEKKTLLTSLMTFAANSFVVRTNNTHRKGIVFFPRIRDKAVFNYWVKMVLSGMASSVGAKSNRKALRQYKRELRKRQLPPIDLGE